ncbi:MAG: hypothetical protein AB7R69_01460 [Candidatus Babeliales bacterium]
MKKLSLFTLLSGLTLAAGLFGMEPEKSEKSAPHDFPIHSKIENLFEDIGWTVKPKSDKPKLFTAKYIPNLWHEIFFTIKPIDLNEEIIDGIIDLCKEGAFKTVNLNKTDMLNYASALKAKPSEKRDEFMTYFKNEVNQHFKIYALINKVTKEVLALNVLNLASKERFFINNY